MIGPGRALGRAARDARRHPSRSALLMSGIAVGVALLVFLFAFVSGTRQALLGRVVSSLPITNITVVPQSFSLSVLRFESPFSDLDPDAVERISAIEGVERVMPMAGLRSPAQLRASFFGRRFVTDTGVFGVDPALIEDQLPADVVFDADSPGPIPAVISSDLIDMYNTGFAKANDLPQLTAEILNGQDATLLLGSSSFSPTAAGSAVVVRLVGVSDRVPLVGVSVPLPVVNEWNRRLMGEDEPDYVQLNVVARSADEVDAIGAAIESLGFSVASGREIAGRIRTLAAVLRSAFGLIAIVVLLVAGIGIANALALSAMERRHEIGIYRAVGAGRGDIRLLFLAQAAILGALGSLVGVGLGFLGATIVDLYLLRALADLPLRPETFFALSWPIALLGFSLGLLVSMAAAISPAHQAARLDPARVLRSG